MTTTDTPQAGIFAQLELLLVHRAVLITISKLEDDQLQVNICPRQLKVDENPALTTPLCVTGTAAELDADLVAQISRFVACHVGLNSNLAAIEKEIAEAEKIAREEAKKKHKVGNGGRKMPDNTTAAPAPTLSKPEAEPQLTPNLFDQQPRTVAENLIQAAPQRVAQAE